MSDTQTPLACFAEVTDLMRRQLYKAADDVRRSNWPLLERDLAAAQKDAERYRWLRSAGWFDDAIMEANFMNELFPDTIDYAIDVAMKETA